MLKFLKEEANMTRTENGAVTYRSTQSECLDLFATIGALRRESDEEITNRFLRAYAENADVSGFDLSQSRGRRDDGGVQMSAKQRGDGLIAAVERNPVSGKAAELL